MSKRKQEEKEQEWLFFNIPSSERQGPDHDEGDGSPYSGYYHTVIEMGNPTAAFFAAEGRGYDSHRAKAWDQEADWTDSYGKQIHCAIVRYSDGGTFGHTEGYFDVVYASPDYERLQEWVKENIDSIKKYHTGHFSRFEGCDHYAVSFSEKAMVKKKDWWNT